MKIIDDRPSIDTSIDFDDLNVGTCFVGSVNGDLYVKISYSLTEKNAFNFYTNQLFTFDGTDKFHPVTAEIHIIEDL